VFAFGNVRHENIGAFCLRMRENCSVRLQMADLLLRIQVDRLMRIVVALVLTVAR
jgi:hypothetical protein